MDRQSPACDRPEQDPRVRFAAERTLLAWMRTGLALMGFGFVVARFGLFLREIAAAGRAAAAEPSTGWSLWIGTALIALGIVACLVPAVEYCRFARAARRRQEYVPCTGMLAVAVAVLLAVLGVAMAGYLVVLGD